MKSRKFMKIIFKNYSSSEKYIINWKMWKNSEYITKKFKKSKKQLIKQILNNHLNSISIFFIIYYKRKNQSQISNLMIERNDTSSIYLKKWMKNIIYFCVCCYFSVYVGWHKCRLPVLWKIRKWSQFIRLHFILLLCLII